MRKITYLFAVAGLTGGTGLLAMGCVDYWTDYYLPLTDPKLAITTSGTAGGGGTGGTGGTGGQGGGGAPPDCSGDPSVTNTIEACAVFAQADAVEASGDGSREKPYKTLQEAIDKAGGKRVYACESAPFAEAVTLTAGIQVVGGFNCAKGWAWKSSARSTLNGPAGAIALTVANGADKAKVENFAINAPSADAAMKGSSSIAVVVADVVAELVRCEVTAGDGAAGESGVTPSDAVTKGVDAAPPDPATMNACINANAVTGGAPGITQCDDGMSIGGVGGKGGVTGTDSGNGQKGGDGEPLPVPNPDAYGVGGVGQTDAAGKCKIGEIGSDGTAGIAGAGGVAPGALSLTGITTDDVTDGKAGTRGQGGGGGGGAKAGMFCAPGGITDGVGASGGGGGGGGCGGKGGGGGKAGGSSIAVLSLGTKLVLTEVTLSSGKGGKGGSGALGQQGGDGGKGADGGAKSATPPSTNGCKGNDGGPGGAGGPGAGGRGGHSLGIAYASAPKQAPALKNFTGGTSGDGGTGPQGAPMTTNGAKGNAGACWDFTKNAACMP